MFQGQDEGFYLGAKDMKEVRIWMRNIVTNH